MIPIWFEKSCMEYAVRSIIERKKSSHIDRLNQAPALGATLRTRFISIMNVTKSMKKYEAYKICFSDIFLTVEISR